MIRRRIWLPLALLSSLSLDAQTDAQRALMNEPEVKQINGMTRDLQRTNDDPDLRGSSLNMAGLSTASLQTSQALLDHLEDRLDAEARACGFCAAKQDELSELIRERIAVQRMVAGILGPGSTSVQQLAGVAPTSSRWNDIRIALRDGSTAITAYCPPLKSQDAACKGDDAPMRLAGGHETAWAKCFNAHNWVERSSERKAYESCMAESDPIAKLCTTARKASPQAAACPTFTVHYADVDQLRFYHDRFSTDPNQLPATATIIGNQAAHFTTLEPLVAPAMTTSPAFQTKIRARLDTPIEGQYAAGLNPSTTNVTIVDANATAGLDGRVILIPAGTEFEIDVIFNGQRGDSGSLNLKITNLVMGPKNFATQNVATRIPWPPEGTVLLAANSPVAFATQCGCPYQMSVAEYRKLAADYASAKAAAPALKYRTLVMGTRIPVVLIDPIDNAGVLAGKRFHAQVSDNSVLPTGLKREDALTVPKGTDVYLKVTDVNDKPLTGQYAAELRIDYLMLDGQKIVITTVGEGLTVEPRLTPPPASRRGGPPQSGVLEPAGARKNFTVAQQTEINTEGMTMSAASVPSAPAPTPPGARGIPTPDVRSIGDFSTTWLNTNVTATGTIASLEAASPWEVLHFKESSDMVACFLIVTFQQPSNPLVRAGGSDFTGLAGKSVQVTGRVGPGLCAGKTGMRILSTSQIQLR